MEEGKLSMAKNGKVFAGKFFILFYFLFIELREKTFRV